MTIDELRARKQFLLARKREELDLQAQGKGDNFNLFMINEELLDVSAQLRALTPSCRVGPKRTTHSTYAADRQQFVDWVRQDTDEEPDDARAQMRKILCGGIASISGRQREILLLWSDGLRGKEIADRLGVDKTTVSRTLKRAKARVKRVSETRIAIDQLRDEDRLDMSDPEVSKLLMSVLTVHQAVCFYLYYAERLSVREVGQLLQVDHSTVCRTVQRAVDRINDALGGEVDILENVEELDNLVFAVYRGLCDRGEDLPPVVQTHLRPTPAAEYITRKGIPRGEGRDSIRHPRLRILTNADERGPGRLLRALQERYADAQGAGWPHPIIRWIFRVFQTITKPRGGDQHGKLR